MLRTHCICFVLLSIPILLGASSSLTPIEETRNVEPTGIQAAAGQETPPSPVDGIRFKISAGDLASAESLLSVHQSRHGEGGEYLQGLGWLARGALLLGDLDKADRYASKVRRIFEERLASGELAGDRSLENAIGAAIEVEAGLIAQRQGVRQAVDHLDSVLQRFSRLELLEDRVALKSRVYKRKNILELSGQQAPELDIEDHIGDRPPSLASLRGKPVVLFIWAEWCGDCKSQVDLLARFKKLYDAKGVQWVTVTRYYESVDPEDKSGRSAEKQRVEDVWNTTYKKVGAMPIVLSTSSMERYGGSSTPTNVFVDREGRVKSYVPTRLTEEEFDRRVQEILE